MAVDADYILVFVQFYLFDLIYYLGGDPGREQSCVSALGPP